VSLLFKIYSSKKINISGVIPTLFEFYNSQRAYGSKEE